MPEIQIESLNHEAQGVARAAGKVLFVDGALPGERVLYSVYQKKPSFEKGQLLAVLRECPQRVTPRCRHFGTCGGCSLQHLEAGAQVAVKQRMLEDALVHIGRVKPAQILRPIHGQPWEYRQRARLSARLVEKKGGVLVGFHERHSRYIADMQSCEVLPARIAKLLLPLRELIGGLSVRDRLPQVEVALGARVDVLVLRVMQPPTDADRVRLAAFADRHGVQFWLQPGGPETAAPYYPLDSPPLTYALPEFGLELGFRPTEFTQVNHAVNRALVGRAVALLDPRPGERVADWFCGLGNFSLALARRGAHVVGVEGSAALVARARENARLNGVGNAEFQVADLFKLTPAALAALGRFDKWLVDPPRDGAMELVHALGADGLRGHRPGRIVYVSCNPATLARDAQVLVNVHGYRLAAAGAVNMFPHTAHVESLALFERD